MSDTGQELSRWERPFWVQTRAQVAGTLIAAGIIAAITAVVALLTSLAFDELVLYVLLPLCAVAVMSTGFYVARSLTGVFRTLVEILRDQDNEVTRLQSEVRRLSLADLTHTVTVDGWSVEDEADGLSFISPEGERILVVDEVGPDAHEVADRLHAAAPDLFDAGWVPFIADVGENAILARREVADLRQHVEQQERATLKRVAMAALGTVAAEARANYGWRVDWLGDRVVFEKENQHIVDQATVRYDEDIDFVKLRTVLGMKPFFQNY